MKSVDTPDYIVYKDSMGHTMKLQRYHLLVRLDILLIVAVFSCAITA